MPKSPSKAFTLVELLVVVAIIATLIGLLLPAVHSAREAARRMSCKNNLKQMALGFQLHESAHSIFPDGGDHFWATRTVKNGSFPSAPNQNIGWPYQILPFVEEESVWAIADYDAMARSRIDVYACPSRRSAQVIPAHGLSKGRGSIDYAGNGGTDDGESLFESRSAATCERTECPLWGMPGNGRDAPVTRRPNGTPRRGASVRVVAVTDGLSRTLLLGEKCLNRAVLGQPQPADDSGWADGWDWDIIRWAFLQPQADFHYANYQTGEFDFRNITQHQSFGSSHPSAFNGAFCDGSIRTVQYTIDGRAFQQMGSRDDGTR